MTMTDIPLSPENSMVLDEIDRAESGSIPRYGENTPPEPPAEAAPEKLPCPECGKPYKASYLEGHRRKVHGVGRKREFKNRNSTKSQVPAVVEPGKGKQAEAEEPLTVDGIVTTLVELRWPHTMPTRKALEMLEVRAVLEKFLT